MRASPLLLPLAILLGGCAAHHATPLPAVAGATGAWIAVTPPGPVAQHWWSALGDPVLDGLIARGLAANPDLAEAQAKLRAARETQAATRGRALPQINASGSATTNAQSGNGMIPFGKLPGVTREYNLFDAGFDAAWEIDLWGAHASAIRAAAARGDSAAAQADGVRLTLAAEIARNYTDLRAAQARRANLAAQVEALSALAALQQARLTAGETARDDALAIRQRLSTARGALAGAEADGTAAANALAVLIAQPPEAVQALAGQSGPIPAAPETPLLGLRSDLLIRRPDVRAAAADVAATRADAAAAHAALFPSLSLTGTVGQQARHGGDFTAGDSLRFGVGPSLHWPVFAAGQMLAQSRGARAQADAAAARYAKAVLSALADSETAANRLARAGQTRDAALDAASAAGATSTLAEQRHAQGEDSRLQALEARLTALTADNAAITARAAHTAAYVALGKALGTP